MSAFSQPAALGGWLLALTAAAGTHLAAHAQPASPASPPIDVMEFAVEGNTVLTVRAVEQAVTPFLGPNRKLDDLEAARSALERAYQTAGYLSVFVDLPEQRVDEGVVRLQVTEGRISRASVTGSRYFSQGYIRDKLPAFTEGVVPNFNTAQQELAVVNRTEQRRVQPVLKPGIEPGTVEVELKVADQLPLSGTVELNNQHAPDTTPWRLQTTLRYDNLFQRDHGISLTASVAPADIDQARAFVLNYTVPLDNGHSVVAYAVDSTSEVATLGGTTVLGAGTTFGLRYAIPFEAGGGLHSVTVGADYKRIDEQVVFGADSFSTPLRYLPLHFGYSGNWSGTGSQTTLAAVLAAGSRSLLQRDVECPGSNVPIDQFACKRFNADGSFATLRLSARHSAAFGWGSLALRLTGQVATQPVPSSEQFALGGVDTIRGYLEGEAVGDHGVGGSFEVRSPNWSRAATAWLDRTPAFDLTDVTLFAFADVGRTQLTQALPGQAARVPLWSTGAGLRMASRLGWSMGLDLARAHKTVSATERGDTRLHVRLGWRY